MLVRRFYDDRLAQASYMIGCQRLGEAIVIDPARDITPYLDAARQEGMKITHVTETHIHADFVSGTRELAAATGATAMLSAEGGDDWQYSYAGDDGAALLHDGDTITLGMVQLDVWHTPGHTPEHLAFVVRDTARSNDPVAMVSGDFVFVGDVGRPDLLEKAAGVVGTMESGARDLYRSLQRLSTLPDYLQMWPGHGAGSACGKALGAMPTSTLGYERRTNWALGDLTEAQFVAAVLEGQPSPPVYFAQMKRINREGPPVLGARPLPGVSLPSMFETAIRDGVVVDLRPAVEYGMQHMRGTLNIPMIRAFTTWAGWLLPYDRDIYLLTDDMAIAASAQQALASIGLDAVRGTFETDLFHIPAFSDWLSRVEKQSILNADALASQGYTVIDLRDPGEWAEGHLEMAQHHPLGRVTETLADLPRDTPLAIHCHAGTRSAIGAAVLERMGFQTIVDLSDGWKGREAAVTA
jgi:hydroxyacylglutathione hydrolase